MPEHKVVTREEWQAAPREELLAREKELTRPSRQPATRRNK
jgi:predicted dithiol-disulfide oxidoreductase (DUF899 family)